RDEGRKGLLLSCRLACPARRCAREKEDEDACEERRFGPREARRSERQARPWERARAIAFAQEQPRGEQQEEHEERRLEPEHRIPRGWQRAREEPRRDHRDAAQPREARRDRERAP